MGKEDMKIVLNLDDLEDFEEETEKKVRKDSKKRVRKVNPKKTKPKQKDSKILTQKRSKRKKSVTREQSKPIFNPNRSVQIDLNEQLLPGKQTQQRKVRPFIDISYIEEISYQSKPGKVLINISYSEKRGHEFKQKGNVSAFYKEDLSTIKQLLERFG